MPAALPEGPADAGAADAQRRLAVHDALAAGGGADAARGRRRRRRYRLAPSTDIFAYSFICFSAPSTDVFAYSFYLLLRAIYRRF